MAKVIISTEWCYEGWNKKEEEYISGSFSELLDNPDVPDESIQWDGSAFEDDKSYFMGLLNKALPTNVERIGIVGRVGLWNATPIGGRIIECHQNPLEYMGNVDRIEAELDREGVVTICGYHHDGVHRMNLFLLDEEDLRELAPAYWHTGEQSPLDMEAIWEGLDPLKFELEEEK